MLRILPGTLVAMALVAAAPPEAGLDPAGLDAFRSAGAGWSEVGGVRVDPDNPRRLKSEPGRGILTNGPAGRVPNLFSRRDFGDVEVHAEFLIPKGSNSGLKLAGAYEIQIIDSFGKSNPRGEDCGGIYPRAELLPSYHHLDEGGPPRVNAARPAGEWQTLDITFRAPQFDASGRKVKPARFVRVLLNGEVVQQDADVTTPTGHAWHNAEHATGPLLLQGDHGPVAFRNLRIRPLDAALGDGARVDRQPSRRIR